MVTAYRVCGSTIITPVWRSTGLLRRRRRICGMGSFSLGRKILVMLSDWKGVKVEIELKEFSLVRPSLIV